MSPNFVPLPTASSDFLRYRTFCVLLGISILIAASGCSINPSAAQSMDAKSSAHGPLSQSQDGLSFYVSPQTAALNSGNTQQFEAWTGNTRDNSASWTCSIGWISNTGLFTAPPVSSYTFATITATSSHNPATRAAVRVMVTPHASVSIAVSPTSATLSSGGHQQFTAILTNIAGADVTWTASAGSISSSGLYAAPIVTSDTLATVTATLTAYPSKQAAATIVVTPAQSAISVSVSPLQSALTSGQQHQFTATVTGTSHTAVTWSAGQGTISTSGLYSAPVVSTSTITSVTATSVADPSAKASTPVVISPASAAALTIKTSSLPSGLASVAYNAAIVASGGTPPYAWHVVAGSQPAGLSLGSTTGMLAGTPSQTGDFSFTAEVTDSSVPAQSATQQFSLTITSSGSSSGVQSSFFGIHVNKSNSPWPNTLSSTFGGLRTLSSGIKWSDINTAHGVYNWSRLDMWLAKAQAAGQDVLYTVYYTPAWASSNPSGACTNGQLGAGGCYPPLDLNADGTGTNQNFKDFIGALMNHVGAGKIKYLEIWNEPNITGEWAGTTPQLVRMAQDAGAVAKAIDSSVQIVGPAETGDGAGLHGLQMNWLNGFLSSGGGNYVDVIALHGYVVNPEDVSTRLANVKGAMATYGQQNKPIFDTEGSWGVFSNLTDEDLQTAFTGRYFLVQISAGVSRLYWFGWDMTNTGDFYNPSTRALTKAGIAYQQIYQWMIGASPAGSCSASGTVWTCNYTRSNGYAAMAVWDSSQTCTSGVCTTSLFAVPPQFVQYRDLTGKLISVTNSQIAIGLKPILLETSSAW